MVEETIRSNSLHERCRSYLRAQQCGEPGLFLTQTEIPEGGAVGETKLGLKGGEDLLLDLLHRVTAEGLDLQRLAHLSVISHCKQHLQLLPPENRKTRCLGFVCLTHRNIETTLHFWSLHSHSDQNNRCYRSEAAADAEQQRCIGLHLVSALLPLMEALMETCHGGSLQSIVYRLWLRGSAWKETGF